MMTFFTENGCLSNSQHGFVPQRSCISQLLQVLNDWTSSLDAGVPIDTVYLDFAKAFDSVAHRRLLVALKSLGISGKLLTWIEGFLTGRKQRVVLEGVASDWSVVTSGVPQGSVLGPTLFVAAVNSLPENIKSSIMIYADDTKLYRSIDSPSDVKTLQDDLNTLATWTETWQLPLNTAKCKVMHIGTANQSADYYISDQKLVDTTEERDLGLLIDKSLSFHAHASAAVAKAFCVLAVIRRSFLDLNEITLPFLFKAMVRPILEYGNCVWGPVFCGDQDKVERVLRRATKMVPAVRNLPYQERLKQLKIPSMHYRRERGDMITVYQILTKKIRVESSDLFTLAPENARTRGHTMKLLKPTANKMIRQRFFSLRVVNSWNALPDEVVMSETTNTFKNRLDNHWKHKMYLTRDNV